MTNISILTTDTNLIVRSWDTWLAEVTGLDAAKVCGKPLTAIVPDLESRGLLARFQKVLTQGVIETLAPAFHHYLIPCPPMSPSGHFEKMQQRVIIAPWWEHDLIIGTIITIEDVTQRLEQELELRAQISENEHFSGLTQENSQLIELGDKNWHSRRQAVDYLLHHSDRSTSFALIKALREQHRNPSILNSVLQVFALSDLDIITPLIECLHDSDVDLRIYAALALGERQDQRAIPALIAALQDPNTNVRFHAIDALGHLRATEAAEPLALIAESQDFFLAFPALESLRKIGDSAIAYRLVPLIENEILREPTVATLSQLGDADVVTSLGILLNIPSAPALAIAQVITAIYDRYQITYGDGQNIADLAHNAINSTGAQNLLAALQVAKTEELRALVLLLGWLNGSGIEQTLTLLLGQPEVRTAVIEALVRYGHRVTQLLVEQLQAEDLEIRLAAIVALGRIGDRRAVLPLIQVLETQAEGTGNQEEGSLIIAAAGALAQIGDRRAFEALLGLIGHREASVRGAAIAALDSLGHPEMPAYLVNFLQDSNPYLRESAVKIAGYFAFPECVELLFERCSDENERVMRAAIEHIAYLEDSRVLPTLATALGHNNPKVRCATVRAFAHLDSSEAFPYLLNALQDSDPWVRYYAIRSIGRQGYREVLEQLAELVNQDLANHVRVAAVEVLGQIGGARAVSILAPLAISEQQNEDLSKAAVAALGQIGHPDALLPLLNVLRSPNRARRIAALTALGVKGRAEVAQTLQWTALVDPDALVAQAAIDALVQIATPEAIAALIELTAEPVRRDAAVTALAQLGEAHLEWIAQGLQHLHTGVRRSVIEALTRLKHKQAVDLVCIALEDEDQSVRLSAVTALKHLSNRTAELKLADMAHTDPDPAVRRAAMRVLQA